MLRSSTRQLFTSGCCRGPVIRRSLATAAPTSPPHPITSSPFTVVTSSSAMEHVLHPPTLTTATRLQSTTSSHSPLQTGDDGASVTAQTAKGEGGTSSSAAPAELTPEQRASFCHPPTVVTAANFEQIVMQSQLAMCLTYHVDNSRCRQFLPRLEQCVNDMNIRCRHRWLSLMTVDADRNPTLAGAFSVERVKLPITYFVFSGTIIDKVNGAVTNERLVSILARFMEYYQEQKGIDLEDHGFVQSAKVETLTEAVSTQEYEGKLEWMLLSKERDWSNAGKINELLEKAAVQSGKDLRELQDQCGMNVKKIDASELFGQYYSKPAYVAAARIAFFKALAAVVAGSPTTTTTSTEEAAKIVAATLSEWKHGMARPNVRFAACVAQLRLAERCANDLSAGNADQAKTPTDERKTASTMLSNISKWVNSVDVPGGLGDTFPQDIADEMLAGYRQLNTASLIAAKKKRQSQQQKLQEEGTAAAAAAAGSSNKSAADANADDLDDAAFVKGVQKLVGDCLRATLQLFPEDAKCNVARSRFSAMMH